MDSEKLEDFNSALVTNKPSSIDEYVDIITTLIGHKRSKAFYTSLINHADTDDQNLLLETIDTMREEFPDIPILKGGVEKATTNSAILDIINDTDDEGEYSDSGSDSDSDSDSDDKLINSVMNSKREDFDIYDNDDE